MVRIACVQAPHLAVQLERQRQDEAERRQTEARTRQDDLPTRPLILRGQPWDPQAVLDADADARAAGVIPGMRATQAIRLCPRALVLPAEEEAYRAVHEALAEALRSITHRLETVGLGDFRLAVGDLGRQYPSPEALGQALCQATQTLPGLDVRVGLAEQRFTAEQAAAAAAPGRWVVAPPGEERRFLAPLPLEVLPIAPELARRLRLLGLETLGALARVPRRALTAQFEAPVGLLHDLATGNDPRPVLPEAPPLALEVTVDCEPPLQEFPALEARLASHMTRLAETLQRRGYQAQGLRLRVVDAHGQPHIAAAAVEPPSADVERLSRQVNRQLENLHLESGVATISLRLYPLRPAYLGAEQLALLAEVHAPLPFRLREVLRRLRERFGDLIITVAALLAPPGPRSIEVTQDRQGQLRALVWNARLYPVAQIYEEWRERRGWWAQPVARDYVRLETRDGLARVVYLDRNTGQWWLERRPP